MRMTLVPPKDEGARKGNGTAEPRPTVLTFATFVASVFTPFYAVSKCRSATRERYAALLKQGLLAHFGEKRLDEIGPGDFRMYAAGLAARGIGARAHLSLARTVLRAALEFGAIPKLPELPKLPKVGKKLPDAPEADVIVTLASASKRSASSQGTRISKRRSATSTRARPTSRPPCSRLLARAKSTCTLHALFPTIAQTETPPSPPAGVPRRSAVPVRAQFRITGATSTESAAFFGTRRALHFLHAYIFGGFKTATIIQPEADALSRRRERRRDRARERGQLRLPRGRGAPATDP